ncbi:acyl-CoA oxidase [Coprinopsis marcescibilis]|uniref:Acyl-CoA oxidase n=1 Tax=Coprinopsis marcescibilis TaxID=230819 RepID=A0A5C3KUW0_COPMA|nr:acyl-CoA oxidase [Coprinopsis marcescibilis]
MPNNLYQHPLFQTRGELLSVDERVALSYQRAKILLQTYRLTARDVQFCTPRYWELMMDPICSQDIAMFTILAAHVGLAVGTLSRHLKKRPDLRSLVERLLKFETVGIYLLTERGHGLDSFNIETTATKTENGFILHTPREEASKFMPASTPLFGIPKVALVMARLIVDGQDRGCRFFIVPVCNSKEMYQGVYSTRLPPRSGTGPLDFSITSFDHVRLPPTALVASDVFDLSAPSRPLEAWWGEVWRIQLGTLSVPAPWISAMKTTAFIGGKYSTRRCILGKMNEPTPIISFRTQQWPIAHCTAAAMVLDNWYPRIVNFAMSQRDPRLRHAFAVIAKTTICRHFQRCVPEIAERCGAQGTFDQNYMARIENDGKGVIIAEGDVLTLCIRLFSELVQERYTLPLPDPSESPLAQHSHSILEENVNLYKALGCNHRSDAFNSLILPQSEAAIEAMGHALAYSAAVESGLPKAILDIYECAVMRQDIAWYSEALGITRIQQRIREDAAISSFMPQLDTFLSKLDIENFVQAPIVTDDAWNSYIRDLPLYSGNAVPSDTFQLQAML